MNLIMINLTYKFYRTAYMIKNILNISKSIFQYFLLLD